MNKTKLMRYAPVARKASTAVVSACANLLRLSSSGTERAGQVHAEPVQVQDDVGLLSVAPSRRFSRVTLSPEVFKANNRRNGSCAANRWRRCLR